MLRLGHLMGYLIRNISMEKACRKSAVETSSICVFNMVNSQNSQFMRQIFENKLFLNCAMEKVTCFFPLHPVTFYGQSFEKQECLELVTSLFELQDMLTKIPFLVVPFESGNCGKRRKKMAKD